jgi:hypothetical protein
MQRYPFRLDFYLMQHGVKNDLGKKNACNDLLSLRLRANPDDGHESHKICSVGKLVNVIHMTDNCDCGNG